MRSPRFMINSRDTCIGRSWRRFLVSFLPRLVHTGGNKLTRCLKASSRSRTELRTISGATLSCKLPHFVTHHRRRTASLILLVISRNHGEGRVVYLPMIKRGMKVHRSVKTRILASPKDEKSKGYVPRIRFTIEGEKEPRCLARDEWLAEPKTEEEEKKRVFKWVD